MRLWLDLERRKAQAGQHTNMSRTDLFNKSIKEGENTRFGTKNASPVIRPAAIIKVLNKIKLSVFQPHSTRALVLFFSILGLSFVSQLSLA